MRPPALSAEVEELSLAFEQKGASFDRLRITKNGRASPPVSDEVRAMCLSAAKAVTALYGPAQVRTNSLLPRWPWQLPISLWAWRVRGRTDCTAPDTTLSS